MMRPDHHDPNAQDNMKPWKNYCFYKFTMSFCYGKDVAEMQSLGCVKLDRVNRYLLWWLRLGILISMSQYVELCHEFYSTYEFDEVCADDELQLKKIIKLGLYQAVELEEEGFNVYFEEGLRNDDNFIAQEYWFSISREDNIGLSRSHTSTIRNPILRVIHKMITYGLCQRTTGLGDCKMDEEKRNGDSKRESNLMWSIYLKACYEMQGVDRGCGKEFECSNLL
ncbi:hypothetical protein Tco_1072971 [Tanacetum coccineum]